MTYKIFIVTLHSRDFHTQEGKVCTWICAGHSEEEALGATRDNYMKEDPYGSITSIDVYELTREKFEKLARDGTS